jgi:serine protease AprX
MGTSGYGTITSPGPYVITVGAMKDMGTVARGDDLIASYSSKGPTLLDQVVNDLVAPGNNIASALASYSSSRTAYPATSYQCHTINSVIVMVRVPTSI